MDRIFGLGIFLIIYGAGIVSGALITFLVAWITDKLNENQCPNCGAFEVLEFKFKCDCEGE